MSSSDNRIDRRDLIQGAIASGLVAVGIRSDRSSLTVPSDQIEGIVRTLRQLGEPLPESVATGLLALAKRPSANAAEIERILDRYTLIRLRLDRPGVGTAALGRAKRELQELGWRAFLVRVDNPARLTGPLTLVSRQAFPEGDLQPGIHESHILGNDRPELAPTPVDLDTDYERDDSQWLGFRFGGVGPDRGLEGYPVEYHVIQLYAHRPGSGTAGIALGSAALPSSSRLYDHLGFIATFDCRPAISVRLGIRDQDGRGVTAGLYLRDDAGRLYPPPGHRLEPDLGYQPQVYRADGETVRLPPGRYQLTALRGPEYRALRREIAISPNDPTPSVALALERWVDPTKAGWYPGDPHVHPEGQTYGVVSKYGLEPETMARQIRGEGLSVGGILIWTGGYYYEKQFLTGHVHRSPSGEAGSVVRYDVEQAAFPSNRLGHPILLRLPNHDWPGGRGIYDWPSWNLPIFQWARAHGGVGGYSHIGHDMSGSSTDLPNYDPPGLDGLGANECLVDVTHGAVDFVAGTENRPVADLNVWYHLLNSGFAIPMVGETDFTGANSRAGTCRTYVGLDRPPVDDAGYSDWVEGLKTGRLYFGDGRSHFIDFRANDRPVGQGPVLLAGGGRVTLSATIAAYLTEPPSDPDDPRMMRRPPYWHLERARLGSSRLVPLEVIVNGRVVDRREVHADGAPRQFSTEVEVPGSSWVALRILPSGHTAPIYVAVAGKPIRASRRSAEWCRQAVDRLWDRQAKRIRDSERPAAAAAWDHARATYRRIIDECTAD